MGKRSDYEPRARDFYETPKKAVEALVGHMTTGFFFCEPCAGGGALVRHIEELFGATCMLATDVEPQGGNIEARSGGSITAEELELCDGIITNPPFTWSVLKPLMDHWLTLERDLVLLLPADFMHNQRFSPYLKHCSKILSIGRVKWIEDSKTAGVDNYAWYWFSPFEVEFTQFIGREKRK